MEAIIFVGIQGTGKSSFYRERFFRTHIRINLDMLKTRHREAIFLQACLKAKQPFVVDNTNPTVADRAKYIALAKSFGFTVVGYYFQSTIHEALQRNDDRPETERIPHTGIWGTHKRLQIPTLDEGFDKLWYVKMSATTGFEVLEWSDEV
jgi:predicted kinase